jgi:hypothetical protein
MEFVSGHCHRPDTQDQGPNDYACDAVCGVGAEGDSHRADLLLASQVTVHILQSDGQWL